MKKNLTLMVCGIFSCSLGNAGVMGPVSQTIQNATPYIGLEGSYTRDTQNTGIVNNSLTNETNQPWGGRLSAGMIRSYTDRLRFNAELGGGYYGGNKLSNANAGFSSNRSIDGYDFLVGALYRFNQFDAFGSAGVMVQNYRIKSSRDLSTLVPGNFLNGIMQSNTSHTQALPEIKVGGIYNLNENWGLSLAYLHAFGSDLRTDASLNATEVVSNINVSTNQQNPTLNSVLLGLRYNII